MKKVLIIILLLLSACSNGSSSNELIASEKLNNNPVEDFFMLNDRVYTKTGEIIDSENREVKKVGEITKVHKRNKKFKNGMATTLTVGTSIYMSNENDFLYIKIKNEYIQYKAEIEG